MITSLGAIEETTMEHIIAKLLRDFEDGFINRRQLIQSLSLAATAAASVGAAGTPAPA